MTNALKELLPYITDKKIKAAIINYHPSTLWENEDDDQVPHPAKILFLKENHTEEEFHQFLKDMDFMYDAGYGGQELHGTIWFETTDCWLTRGEYDGSEWWDLNYMPEIPGVLTGEILESSSILTQEFFEADYWDGDESDKSLQ